MCDLEKMCGDLYSNFSSNAVSEIGISVSGELPGNPVPTGPVLLTQWCTSKRLTRRERGYSSYSALIQ